ncbi:interleukin-8-like isoform X2 [Prinia subflava]|uniref:interleukin-8-like isoform X2 n=1 Tax=Prinia subflava TaxID=208062 RepID=UPI002FE0B144
MKQQEMKERRGKSNEKKLHRSISQVWSFRGYDPPVMLECPGWPGQDISTAGLRAQALATPGSARAHSTTEPGPGHTRKTRSCIMIGKTVAVVLILLLISALGTQGEAVPRSAIELRCQCINTHSRFIHPKFIQNVNLTPSGPHCKNVEVIATLRDGREVCLEPTASWVNLIIKAILHKANTKPSTVS